MTAVQIVFGIVLIVLALAIILLVLVQESNQQGLSGAISGGSSESFFGKNKGRTDEAKKAFLTKILATVFMVIALITVVVSMFAK
ncbi:MAG: preprotein translocase subunit SecG [Clostridia bacterium]|nr:preprotein translocase subunit SecG [Clostridia bacterium]